MIFSLHFLGSCLALKANKASNISIHKPFCASTAPCHCHMTSLSSISRPCAFFSDTKEMNILCCVLERNIIDCLPQISGPGGWADRCTNRVTNRMVSVLDSALFGKTEGGPALSSCISCVEQHNCPLIQTSWNSTTTWHLKKKKISISKHKYRVCFIFHVASGGKSERGYFSGKKKKFLHFSLTSTTNFAVGG